MNNKFMGPTQGVAADGTKEEAGKLTSADIAFLSRFVGRGWLHATRDDAAEQDAVTRGLRGRYLRRELGEVHFTPAGRAALHSGGRT